MILPKNSRWFTTRYSGIMKELVTQVHVGPPADPEVQTPSDVPFVGALALWDTGATGCAVTQSLVQRLGLQPTGVVRVFTASGEDEVDSFLVSLGLPNGVVLPVVNVSTAELRRPLEVIIGMDVICHGDLAISNFSGTTILSFRIPSLGPIDFDPNAVRSPSIRIPAPPRRNDPCPCGSGKKYKHCHGRPA